VRPHGSLRLALFLLAISVPTGHLAPFDRTLPRGRRVEAWAAMGREIGARKPAANRAWAFVLGAGDGNRTRALSLGSLRFFTRIPV
jgi:hypothetical protein